jgi:hypothetical protein
MLNELSDHVDSTEGRLATARRKLEDFIRKSEGTLSFSPSPPPPSSLRAACAGSNPDKSYRSKRALRGIGVARAVNGR